MEVWLNMYPQLPASKSIGEVAAGVGTSGANIRYSQLTRSELPDYIALDPNNGALAAWLNGCDNKDTSEKKYRISITHAVSRDSEKTWAAWEHKESDPGPIKYCQDYNTPSVVQVIDDDNSNYLYPIFIDTSDAYSSKCFYTGSHYEPGHLVCDGVGGIRCRRHP
jgi:hypothetical protein